MRDKGQRRDLWFSRTSAAMAADLVAPPLRALVPKDFVDRSKLNSQLFRFKAKASHLNGGARQAIPSMRPISFNSAAVVS